MIKNFSICLIIFLNVHNLNAQFINLQITVEPELSASVEKELNFGELVVNSGSYDINFGDINMGIFNIKAFHTQNLFIRVDHPSTLIHSDPSILDEIQIDFSIAYNYSGNNNLSLATILNNNNSAYLPIQSNTSSNEIGKGEVWKKVYLYIFGSINVGNITPGVYNGELSLNVAYD